MTDADFITRLEHQLSEAERRQELGGRAGRAWAAAQAWAPSRVTILGLVAAAAVLVVVAVVVGAGVLSNDRTQMRVGEGGPREVARVPLGDVGVLDAAAGFGSIWVGDFHHDDVIRVDAATRQVVARIPSGRQTSGVVATDDAVWAVVNPEAGPTTLLRIDPRSNQVTARVPVPAVPPDRGGTGGGPVLVGGSRALWLLGSEVGARIDPRTGRVLDTVRWPLAEGAYAGSFALHDRLLWVHETSGRLLGYDPKNGTRRAGFPSTPGAVSIAAAPGGDVVVATRDGTLTRYDAATGRTRWLARVPDSAPQGDRSVAVVGDVVWVLREDAAQGTVRLIAVDLERGRALAETTLSSTSPVVLLSVAGELWFTNQSSEAVVVKP
jgi:hypothetical protein